MCTAQVCGGADSYGCYITQSQYTHLSENLCSRNASE